MEINHPTQLPSIPWLNEVTPVGIKNTALQQLINEGLEQGWTMFYQAHKAAQDIK